MFSNNAYNNTLNEYLKESMGRSKVFIQEFFAVVVCLANTRRDDNNRRKKRDFLVGIFDWHETTKYRYLPIILHSSCKQSNQSFEYLRHCHKYNKNGSLTRLWLDIYNFTAWKGICQIILIIKLSIYFSSYYHINYSYCIRII